MAKKKKNTKEAISSISYSGKVRIDFYKGNKIYKTINTHNAGTAEFFRYIANCIVGNYNSTLKPSFIHTFYCDPDKVGEYLADDRYKPQLWSTANSKMSLNTPASTFQVRRDSGSSGIESGYVSEITFMIPHDQIRDKSNVIALYNSTGWGDGFTPLAYVILDNKQAEQFDVGSNNSSNIAITWTILIKNQIEGE